MPLLATVDDARFEGHRAPSPHPERPERLIAARDGLEAALGGCARRPLPPRRARREELSLVHDPAYLDRLEARLGAGCGSMDPDTYICEGSEEAVMLAAGGAIGLAEHLLLGSGGRGLALLRPPGHHATPSGAMGFCLLNNIALGAACALEAGAERVAIVDWDVHHGNGTEEAFYDDPRVLFVSTHQWPLYPGTGRPGDHGVGAGRGSTMNIALPEGTGPAAMGEAFRTLILPKLGAFSPELILVSCGFDAHRDDPLGGLALDASCFGAMTSALVEEAERLGHGRVGLILEGGYDLAAIEASTQAVVGALLGAAVPLPTGPLRAEEAEALAATRRIHGL
ncbi:MAG: histone deacetylase [Myxococcales bacterium]|nr:histone deacetylase [Myxococcales bacterium]